MLSLHSVPIVILVTVVLTDAVFTVIVQADVLLVDNVRGTVFGLNLTWLVLYTRMSLFLA